MAENRFSSLKSLGDYLKAEEDFRLKKQLAEQQVAKAQSDAAINQARLETGQLGGEGQLPVGIQYTNAFEKALEEKNYDRANRLLMFTKAGEKGLGVNETGEYYTMPGYAQALGDLGYQKKFGETMGQQDVLAQTEPLRKEDIARREAEVQLQYKPLQTTAVSKAESQAEKTSDLDERRAYLPQLMETVDKLSDLGKKATYTTAGKVRDSLMRELGMDVGEGAVARKEYISLVDNQILPLLRQTFGAAFTQKEGDNLKQTLGDPDASPKEKDAVLRSFIKQKIATINTLENQLGQPKTQVQQDDPYAKARKAIEMGADRKQVEKRLIQNGLNPGNL